MRKEQSQFSWSWENENSAYKNQIIKINLQWEMAKGWIKDISKYALDRDVSIYKAMQIKHLEKENICRNNYLSFFHLIKIV